MKTYLKYFFFNSLFLIGAVLLLANRFPTYFYSPEELSAHHLKLTCEACHVPFQGVKQENCISEGCHTGKKMKMADPLLVDLHEKYKKKNCLDCHTDHVKIKGKVTRMLNHEFLEDWPKNQCLPCHAGDDSEATHLKKFYSRECAACHSIYTWTIKDFSHDALPNRNECGLCHFAPKDIMHAAESRCQTCHTKTIEWIVGYAEIQKAEPESNPQEGIDTFFSWREMVDDGTKFNRNKEVVKKWEEKLSGLDKISGIKTGGLWTSALQEGDAIYIKKEGRDDPIYKAVVKIFPGPPRRILFSIDDDFGRIMEESIPADDLENPVLKEIFELGYLEKGAAKSSLNYAKYLIEIEEESIAHPGKKIRKIIIDPSAKDYIYSGDAASGIESDF